MYWWVTTVSTGGRFCVFGPYDSEESASEYGFAHFGSNFESVQLSTKDIGRATRALRKKRFDEVGDLDLALQRIKHQIPKE